MSMNVAYGRGSALAGAVASSPGTMVPPLIVTAAVLFNPLLAIVNAHLGPISASIVIVAEIAIVGAAHGYALMSFDRRMRMWYAYLVVIALFAGTRALATGIFEIKFLRDLMMIPTFVVLGMATSERGVINCIVCLTIVVVGFVLLEAGAVDAYSQLFEVKAYYINTRGIAAGEFTNEASSLFVSATRPEARFFPFFDLHRLSSVFLEPVSLGNFAIICVCFTIAFWTRLAPWQRLLMPAAIGLVLFACDGRLSAICSVVVLGTAVMSRVLPHNVALLFLPMATALVVGTVVVWDLEVGTDDIPGRIAHTQHWLSQMWLSDVVGASDRLLPAAEDSGVVYIIVTQSLPGLVLLWCMIVLGLDERSAVHQRYKNGICLYLALTMMISFAFVTIKTAAPLWLVYGFLIVSGRDLERPHRRSGRGRS